MNRISTARAATATAVVLATTGGLIGVAASTSSAAVTCASPVFKRQFFANTSFSGTPKKTDCDSAIDQNWGTGAPASGLPSNYFGVRWSVTRDFGSGGPFAFTASSRDGIRVYLDGVRKVDLWKNVSTTVSKTVNLTIPQGKHSLRIDFVNWTGSADVKFAYAPRTSATVDTVKPLTPGGAALTYSTSTYKSKLSWTRSPEMDLAGYQVYRRVSGGSYPVKPLAVATASATSYTDTPPMDGKLYYYEVRAYDKAGNTSAGTADKGVTTTKVATPAGVTATATDTAVGVRWNPVPGASAYKLYRNGTTLTTVKGATAYSDTAVARSVSASYRVAAVDTTGTVVSPLSTASAAVRRPVAAPRSLTATPGLVKASLKWSVPADGGSYAGFHVYRSTSVTVDTTGEPLDCTVKGPVTEGDQRYWTCVDNTAEGGVTYHYVVKGYDSAGTESAASGAVQVTPESRDLTAPAAPTGLTVTPTEYGFTLDWDDNTEADLHRYGIYKGSLYDDGDGGQVCLAHLVDHTFADTSELEYRAAADGEEVCFLVSAIDTAWNDSFRSTGEGKVVQVRELDLRPSEETPASGSPVDVTVVDDGGEISLSWYGGEDATGYRVHRWDGTSYVLVHTLDGGGRVSWTDPSAPRGTTSFYRVTAVLADGTETAPAGVAVALLP
ncbi:fibronectin type III domain-containing protein [Streptomyces fragilis]|uniref:PA14 domain-containing protein n=1 Tax=Streptomyces fragilis TaxID=67301 RepID=A0ABV2YQ21_9ACTN|nr:PA14 domain-containing protein [Streptomyces fragilis]